MNVDYVEYFVSFVFAYAFGSHLFVLCPPVCIVFSCLYSEINSLQASLGHRGQTQPLILFINLKLNYIK